MLWSSRSYPLHCSPLSLSLLRLAISVRDVRGCSGERCGGVRGCMRSGKEASKLDHILQRFGLGMVLRKLDEFGGYENAEEKNEATRR